MDYTNGIGAEVDALCALFSKLAVTDAFSPDTPDLYKDTGMQVLVQSPEPDMDTHVLFIIFGTEDNHLVKVIIDVKEMRLANYKKYLSELLQQVMLNLFDAREARASIRPPELILPKNIVSNSVARTLH